jgi:hypothetical protein
VCGHVDGWHADKTRPVVNPVVPVWFLGAQTSVPVVHAARPFRASQQGPGERADSSLRPPSQAARPRKRPSMAPFTCVALCL